MSGANRPAGEFPPAAFEFILEALHAVVQGLPVRRHITGRELIDGCCQLARERYDFLAPLVLRRWGLCRAQDLGRAVFTMVSLGLLARRDEDTPADFNLPLSLEEEAVAGLDHLSAIRAHLQSLGVSSTEASGA